MKNPDLYDILGCARGASARDLKSAYRRRAKAAHPDKGGSDEELKSVNEAWETLGDPERRRRYDETGEVAGAAARISPGETMFLSLLDEVLGSILDEGKGNLLVSMKRKLDDREQMLRCKRHALSSRIDLVESQLGRFVLTEDPATTRPYEAENFVERRLADVLRSLQDAWSQLTEELSAVSAAKIVCRRFEDTRPDLHPDHRSDAITIQLETFRTLFGGR